MAGITITRETISRILKDVKQIINNPLSDNGIYYSHDDSDMLKGYALIIGPSETPYFGGNYFFEFDYPPDYPHSPPIVKYWTNGNNIRFNPNLYKCGKVCVSLLNTWRGDQWSSCQTISSVLLTLCTLLCSDPLLNEPGVTKSHSDMSNYNDIIQYSNFNIAICHIVEKKEGYYMPFFDLFYHHVKNNFLKNYDALLESAQQLKDTTYKTKTIVKTGMYNMNVEINYDGLINKLTLVKKKIDLEL
jgi:ubiquitin-protein ligase